MKLSRIEPYLKYAFIILILVFLGLYLRDIDFSMFSSISINWLLLALASVISLCFRYWGVVIWRFILHDLGAKELPPFSALAEVYAKAWMGRYIPGTVTWIAGKVYMANKLGISKSRLAVSSVLEGGMQIIASMSVALLLLGIDPRLNVISSEVKIIMVALAAGSLIILLPPVFNYILHRLYVTIRKKAPYDQLRTTGKATFRSYFLYAIGSFLLGSAYYFLVTSIYDKTDPSMYWYIVGTFTLSGALGMATPFVPSGLGVRDGVQLVLLSLIMPKEVALAVTIFSRLWSLGIDITFWGIASNLVPSISKLFQSKQES